MSKVKLIIEPNPGDILETQTALAYIVLTIHSCNFNHKNSYSINIEKIKRIPFFTKYKIILSSKELYKDQLKQCVLTLLANSNKFSIEELK